MIHRRFLIRNGIFSIRFSQSDQFYLSQRSLLYNSRFISSDANQYPFTVSYLIDKCGFSPKEASLLASRYVRIKCPDVPDTVIAFLKRHGFSQSQIRKVVKNKPNILLWNPDKTLFPKLDIDVARIFSGYSSLFARSLERRIIPCYNYFHELIQSDEKLVQVARRCPRILAYDVRLYGARNIDILKGVGVPMSNLAKAVYWQPSIVMLNADRNEKNVEELKRLRFDPSSYKFLSALAMLAKLSKSTVERKFHCFRAWGWSKEDFFEAFKREPICISHYEEKINAAMDFLVNKMGQDPFALVRLPKILGMSMEKRIIPRAMVAQVLVSNGLIKKDLSLSSLFYPKKTCFFKDLFFPMKEKILSF
ncbi:hypothetical protein K2173_013055 [Erythroxylum novogranatense]|uniref:Mitochondrial transcription termination factor family protein n=1 Tax=Erythroxylum novogranatense TaxID=1862640 RepID=A0AAV8S634_9ROSI|nr:hypothetical protein K2173_013055 [Erythroxylum novogranatense]